MRRFAVNLLTLALLFVTAGCGGTAFYISPDNGTIFFATGTVTSVDLVISSDGQVTTIIIFDNNGVTTAVTFCDNVVPQFPPNNFVSASYRQGTGCNTLVQVVL